MSHHDKTLELLMEQPSRSDVRWTAFVALILHKGGTVAPGAGSHFRLSLNGARAVMHRPHPGEQMSKAQVDSAREFLVAADLKSKPAKPASSQKEAGKEPNPTQKSTKKGGTL